MAMAGSADSAHSLQLFQPLHRLHEQPHVPVFHPVQQSLPAWTSCLLARWPDAQAEFYRQRLLRTIMAASVLGKCCALQSGLAQTRICPARASIVWCPQTLQNHDADARNTAHGHKPELSLHPHL